MQVKDSLNIPEVRVPKSEINERGELNIMIIYTMLKTNILYNAKKFMERKKANDQTHIE